MPKIVPTDDAIATAAAQLTDSLVRLRLQHLHGIDFAAQERHVLKTYWWLVDQLVHERNAKNG